MQGNNASGILEMSVKVVGNGYLMMQIPVKPKRFHLTSKDKQTGKKKEIKCLEPKKGEKVWTVKNDTMIFGCVVKMEKGKHLMGISVDVVNGVPFWMFVSY